MNTNRKRSNKKVLIIVLAVVVVAIISIIVYVKNAGEPPIAVSFAKVEKRTIIQIVSATGTIMPETQVKISPEVSGEIVKLDVKEGDTVKKGALLARINPVTIEAQLEQGRAQVAASKEDAAQIKVQLSNLQSELNRIKELYNKKFASQQDLDNAQATYDATLASYNGTLARTESAQANLKQIETEARKTTIFAPLDGIVTSLLVEEGERVVGTSLMTGTEMLTVADLNVINAEVDVDENDIVLVKVGDTADVEIDAVPNQIFKGVVIEVGHSASNASTVATSAATATTTFKVKVRLIDASVALRPGMSCNVDIHTARHIDVLSVPLQAVTSRDDITMPIKANNGPGPEKIENTKTDIANSTTPTTIVFVRDKNKAKIKEVKIGISDMGFVEILSGLTDGEEIISGSYTAVSKLLKDGSVIKDDNPIAASKK